MTEKQQDFDMWLQTRHNHAIEGSHVMSYQANFASHHTPNCHVGFLSHGAVLENTIKCPKTFYLVHTTIPNYNWVTRISAHTFNSVEILILSKLIKSSSILLLFFSILCHAERKPSNVTKSCTYRCVLCRANPLLGNSIRNVDLHLPSTNV